MMKSLLFLISFMGIITCSDNGNNKEGRIEGIAITVLDNRDTLIQTTKRDTLNGQFIVEEIKPYKETPTPPASTPVSSSKKISYLSLPQGIPTVYTNLSNLVIEGLQFTNKSGSNLVFQNCKSIVIRNCYFGASSEEAISIENGSNITIQNNLFANNKGGIYALTTIGSIVIRNNQFINVKGPVPRGQYVQLDECTGAGNIIENNKGESWPGESDPEDLISVFKSRGSPESPILIRNNIFRGGGPSSSGGGIMTGDTDGGYVIVENNILVDPGQYGIAAAGGKKIIIRNNKVFGRSQHFSNVGIYVWAQGDVPCADIEVSNNLINYTRGNIKTPQKNDLWDAENCGTVTGLETNKYTLTLEELKMPDQLVDFVTPSELLRIRGKL
jgi:parallel beta-helix repeat protein